MDQVHRFVQSRIALTEEVVPVLEFRHHGDLPHLHSTDPSIGELVSQPRLALVLNNGAILRQYGDVPRDRHGIVKHRRDERRIRAVEDGRSPVQEL